MQANKIGLFIIAFILGPILAWWAGDLVVEEDYLTLGSIVLVSVGIWVMNSTRKHLLEVCLILATLDLWMAPIGFKTSSFEQIILLIAVAYCMFFWSKNFNQNAPCIHKELFSFTIFKGITILNCLYAGVHFLLNMAYPYEPLAFGFNGALKTYLQYFGPFLLIIILLNKRLIYPKNAKESSAILKYFLISTIIVFLFKLIMIIRFGDLHSSGSMTASEKMESIQSFHIPLLNIWDNSYTLRTLGPAAVLIGSVFYFQKPILLKRWVPLLLLLFGFAGSAISGGRAVVLISTLFLIISLLKTGNSRIILFMLFSLIATILLFASVPLPILEKAPFHFQRAVAFIRPDLQTEATMGIQGSSNMRMDYFKYAWKYYLDGDLRLFLTGRSVGEMDVQDEISILNYDEAARLFFAIRRLATHNGLTDALIGWGLIGYILSLSMWISCMVMLYALNKMYLKGSHGECWSFAAMVFFLYWIIYSHIGGSFVWMLSICFILIAFYQTDGLKNMKSGKKI